MTTEELILRNQISIMEALTFLVQQSRSLKTPRLIAEMLVNAAVESEEILEAKKLLNVEE